MTPEIPWIALFTIVGGAIGGLGTAYFKSKGDPTSQTALIRAQIDLILTQQKAAAESGELQKATMIAMAAENKANAVALSAKTDHVAATLATKTDQAAMVLAAKVDEAAQKAKEDTLINREATKEVHRMLNSELLKWKADRAEELEQWKSEQKAMMEEWKVQHAKITEMAIIAAHKDGYERRRSEEHARPSPLESKLDENTAATEVNTAKMASPPPGNPAAGFKQWQNGNT